jgi:uncharacterized protein
MSRVLVTGGTGFIGRALVAKLRERGDTPVVVSRRAEPPAVPWDAVEEEVNRADAVVHLAGEPIADGRWTGKRLAVIRVSRVESTERIARAIQQASCRPKVLVSGSAVGIYGMRSDDTELDESAAPADDVLASIVVAWEKAADGARSAGVRVVHPRTGVVLGKGAGALTKMASPFKWFVGGPLGGGQQWVSWIHLHDAVRALLFTIDNETVAGPVNVVAPTPVTMETLAQSIGRVLHRPAALHAPAFALKLALGNGLAQMLLTGQRVVPRKLLDAGFVFEFPQVERACADLLQ